MTTSPTRFINENFSGYDDLFGLNATQNGMYNFYTAPQLGFVSTLCIFIIVGNLCVLGAIRLSESGRKSRMNFFILHLALSDLLVGLLVCITDIMSKITVEWYAGNFMCKLVNFLQGTFLHSSTYMLVSLSIDRYYAVARPMSFTRSGSQAKILVAMAWIASVVFASPYIILYKVDVIGGKSQCWIEFPELWYWQFFFTLNSLVTFFMPTIIIASCYVAIIHIIWSKGRRKRQSRIRYNWLGHRAGGGGFEHERHHVTISDSRHDTSLGVIPQAKIRTVKMTLIIVIVFILCWSPYFLYNLLDLYGIIPSSDPLSTFIQSAAPLNSAANPIIYGIFSTRICRNLRRLPIHPLIRKAFCCCHDMSHKDNYHNGNPIKGNKYSQQDQSNAITCRANRKRHGNHKNQKHPINALVVTANEKGYSSTKLTQCDSAMNIDSSTTTDDSNQFTHVEMNLISSKSHTSLHKRPLEMGSSTDLECNEHPKVITTTSTTTKTTNHGSKQCIVSVEEHEIISKSAVCNAGHSLIKNSSNRPV